MYLGWSFLKIAKRIKFNAELLLPWQQIGKSLKKIIKNQLLDGFQNNITEVVVLVTLIFVMIC